MQSSELALRAQTERRIVAAFSGAHDDTLVIAPTVELIAPLRHALGALESSPYVICVQELPVDVDVQIVQLPTDPLDQ